MTYYTLHHVVRSNYGSLHYVTIASVMCIPLQKYWNNKANSFVFDEHWRLLGLKSKDEYEAKVQNSSFKFMVFSHILSEQSYWNRSFFK